MKPLNYSVLKTIRQGIAKVLVGTVLVTSMVGGYQPSVFASPSTKTQTDKDYQVTFEEKDLAPPQSDWNFSNAPAPIQVQGSTETISREVLKDGKWQTLEVTQATWSEKTLSLIKEASFSGNGVGKQWPVTQQPKVEAVMAPVQPGENKAASNPQEAPKQYATEPKSSNLKLEAIKADYSLGERIQTPVMRAAGVQTYTSTSSTFRYIKSGLPENCSIIREELIDGGRNVKVTYTTYTTSNVDVKVLKGETPSAPSGSVLVRKSVTVQSLI